ncbi:hypothetical protein CDD83_9843 [Cordyceps sp. RAO-2017]|nr:hypothetical protein CDD83_9843 [Cordyceps sp. RAO-2017]
MSSDGSIVAVHGLNGDARGTWTAGRSGICLLSHPDFLPKYVKKARILSWGYYASFSSLLGQDPSKERIHHHAHTLVSQSSADRRLDEGTGRPIVFLCHSLGGIIVKKALCYSERGQKTSHEYNTFSSTHAILFFGTPHNGSSKASLASNLSNMVLELSPVPALTSKSDLVSALKPHCETLQNINDSFEPIMKNDHIFFFWEQERTNLLFKHDYIVTQDSAAPVHDETGRAGITANHSGMVKFERASDQGFVTVAEAVTRYCGQAMADIGRKQAYADEMLR